MKFINTLSGNMVETDNSEVIKLMSASATYERVVDAPPSDNSQGDGALATAQPDPAPQTDPEPQPDPAPDEEKPKTKTKK
ncbi:MAG: hypothetical protein J6A79_12580 [Clostridia bacterium]|nr:hypothetical protein [Clostridia bacterium]